MTKEDETLQKKLESILAEIPTPDPTDQTDRTIYEDILYQARQYMVGRRKGSWRAYDYFKSMLNGRWIDGYHGYIRELTEVLKI